MNRNTRTQYAIVAVFTALACAAAPLIVGCIR
mgnify:CR=1 FL=1